LTPTKVDSSHDSISHTDGDTEKGASKRSEYTVILEFATRGDKPINWFEIVAQDGKSRSRASKSRAGDLGSD
jgi:hypothetical protein